MKLLTDIPKDELRGKRVIVRAGFDVPLAQGAVVGDFRLERAIPTLAYLRECGARVIVIAHIGREVTESLEPVARALRDRIPLTFIPDTIGETARAAIAALQDGESILLENLRRDPREVENNTEYAEMLASYGELYVNDAFSASHRAHASIVGIPKFVPSMAGLELAKEVAELTVALAPTAPSLCILGGAKFETKEPLIRMLLGSYDHVFVGGALANDILKAQGYEVGISRVGDVPPTEDVLTHSRLLIPQDLTVQHEDGTVDIVPATAMRPGDRNMDIGPLSLAQLEPLIREASVVLWNGPMGIYEEGFEEWTIQLAKLVAEKGTHSIVGGGDTVTAIADAGVVDRYSFISTGGGAMLDFLTHGTLPGIAALS